MNVAEMVKMPARNLRPMENLVNLVRDMPRQDPRFALFLGAGSSWSSGIPTAENLVAQWRRQMFLSQNGKDRWWPHYKPELKKWDTDYQEWCRKWEAVYGRQPSEYSLLFSHFCPDVDARQGFIENICSGCEPGPGYIYLASLKTPATSRPSSPPTSTTSSTMPCTDTAGPSQLCARSTHR